MTYQINNLITVSVSIINSYIMYHSDYAYNQFIIGLH